MSNFEEVLKKANETIIQGLMTSYKIGEKEANEMKGKIESLANSQINIQNGFDLNRIESLAKELHERLRNGNI